MSNLFADGDIALLIILCMLVEGIVLILVRKKASQSLTPLDVVMSLGGGAALLLALRDALRGAAWPHVAIWLIVALACHLWDLKLRWATRRTG